jgi:predicted HicB family RNase H-like nuclease
MNTNFENVLSAYTVKIVELGPEDGGGHKATYDELGLSATGYGCTRAEAMAALEESALALAESMASDGEELPPPAKPAEWKEHSGRVTLRIPRALHALLDRQAEEQEVSLNSLMAAILQGGATALEAGVPFGPVRRAGADILWQLAGIRAQHESLCRELERLEAYREAPIAAWPRSDAKPANLDYQRIS